MEPIKAKINDKDLIDVVRKAAYIHFGKQDILALEELLRRYRNAKSGPTSERPDSQSVDNREQ